MDKLKNSIIMGPMHRVAKLFRNTDIQFAECILWDSFATRCMGVITTSVNYIKLAKVAIIKTHEEHNNYTI